MSRRIDIYYDIVSPYSYIGFEVLCRYRSAWDLAINFRPFLLAGIMKGASNQPPGLVPAKGKYMMKKDLPRLANHYGVPVTVNKQVAELMFGKGTLATMRFLTAVQQRQPDAVEPLSRELYHRLFSQFKDVSEPASLREAAERAGLTAATVDSALADANGDAVKGQLRAATDEALSLGAFGSPIFVVHTSGGGKEMVFGSDRFNIIADLLGVEYKGPLKHMAKL